MRSTLDKFGAPGTDDVDMVADGSRVWTRAEQAAANKRNLGRGGWGVARRSPEPWAGGRLGGSPAEPGTLGGWAEPWAGGRLGGSPAEPGTLGGNIGPKPIISPADHF